jgi:hypothetical protein
MLRRTLRRNKGITLIALVVTIIVLLILAGISISLLAGQNGILSRAVDAKEKIDDANIEESIKLATEDALTQGLGTINDLNLRNSLNSNIGKENYQMDGNEDWGWIVLIKNKKFKIDKNGKMSIFYGWKENDENNEFYDENGNKLTIGEYVNYKCTEDVNEAEKIQYISSKDKNGYGDQTFTLQDYKDMKWQVLGIDEFGCLQLISSNVIIPKNQSSFIMKGKIGYTNAINELNKISSLYGKGKYAREAKSIKVEEINKITGYVDNEYNKSKETVIKSGNTVKYKKIDGKIYYQGTEFPIENTISEYNIFKYIENENIKQLENEEYIEIENTHYSYYPQTLSLTNKGDDIASINGKKDQASIAAYNLLFENTSNEMYWLASKSISTEEGRIVYRIRGVINKGIGSGKLFFSNDEEWATEGNVRVVVSLKPDVKIVQGNGKVDTPWILYE